MDRTVQACLDRAADHIRRHVADPARADALGLRVHQVFEPTPLVYTRFPPAMSMVLHGRKRSIVGDEDSHWGNDRFLIIPVDLPVVAQVVGTGDRGDFVSANWSLDPLLIAEVAARSPRRPVVDPPPLGTWTPELAEVVDRLFRLLSVPEEIPVLGASTARELTFRLLQSDQGARLLDAVASSRSDVVTRTIDLVTARLDTPWSLDTLAAEVGTSTSTLTRRFREVTAMSPMHYLKRLRLGEARRRMLVLGDTASRAATAVGYVSASHFSRDYRTFYESTPSADTATLRGQLREVV